MAISSKSAEGIVTFIVGIRTQKKSQGGSSLPGLGTFSAVYRQKEKCDSSVRDPITSGKGGAGGKQITTGDSLYEIRQLLDCGREKGWGRIGFTGANSGCTEQENQPDFTANCSSIRPFLCQSLRAVHRAQKNRRL